MRRTRLILVTLVLALFASVAATPARAEVSFDFFYSNLEPHGSWYVSAEYGRVWQPREYDRGWNPYYDGHWQYSEVGWVWVSDYRWGAIPYHYGTWVMDARYGWVWAPGYTWAPAWVTFRTGPDYIGWAPVAPSFSVGVSFGGPAPYEQGFIFVSTRDFAAPRIRSCVIPESRSRVVINNTKVVNNLYIQNNIVVNRGPDVRVVERASGRKFQKARIEQVTRVAPFSTVTRSRLAIDPKKARGGLRVTAPSETSRAVVAEPERRQQIDRRSSREQTVEPRSSQLGPSRPEIQQRDTRKVEPQKQAKPVKKQAPKPAEKKQKEKPRKPAPDKDKEQH